MKLRVKLWGAGLNVHPSAIKAVANKLTVGQAWALSKDLVITRAQEGSAVIMNVTDDEQVGTVLYPCKNEATPKLS